MVGADAAADDEPPSAPPSPSWGSRLKSSPGHHGAPVEKPAFAAVRRVLAVG
ncbi:MAG TPA: hypothetical protein VLL08_08110 [Kineosporiaceae bacterium]|nr:hypothetical protein [Kineosporiaceae bacterium]